MKSWINFLVAFGSGLAVGVVVAAVFFESRLRLYKEYIEQRLAAINRFRSQSPATHGMHKPSSWKDIFTRHPASRSGSKSIGDD